MSAGLDRSRGIRTERGRTRRPRPRLGDWRAGLVRRPRRRAAGVTEALFLGELGVRFRDDPRKSDGRATTEGRVLIVDDESAIRLVCRVNLDAAGFETLEAGDGETGLALARSEQPDLILLDIMLPGADGWDVAGKLSEDPATKEIPVVFLTARSTGLDELRGHDAGGVGYIAKPFDPTLLTEIVTGVIRRTRSGERDELRREWEQSLSSD